MTLEGTEIEIEGCVQYMYRAMVLATESKRVPRGGTPSRAQHGACLPRVSRAGGARTRALAASATSAVFAGAVAAAAAAAVFARAVAAAAASAAAS